MSRIYDNWERLVKATLLREKLREISRQDSLSSSSSSFSSSFHRANLGISLSHHQIILSTNYFSNQNLIKRGVSGDLFRGFLQSFSCPIVIKRIDFRFVSREAFSLELNFLSTINSHKRFVPVLGYCFEEEEKFLVYKYATNGDLLNSLYFKKRGNSDDSLSSLDWITRLKIAIGAAEGLSYLHHECDPPIAHGDIQASSIILDDDFEVRLGSLRQVCTQERESTSIRKSEKKTQGTPNATCAYDVYCFGKVLLELVTGKLGISSSTDAAMKEWLDATLPYISIYDKELVTNIVDPSLIIDEDLLKEVWAMAIVARSCLNPKPTRRPLMRHILKTLEHPLKLVRGEHTSSARLRTTSSRGSRKAALFGRWRRSSSDVVAVPTAPSQKVEGTSSLKPSGSQGSRQNGDGNGNSSSTRRNSKDIVPEPLDEQVVERAIED